MYNVVELINNYSCGHAALSLPVLVDMDTDIDTIVASGSAGREILSSEKKSPSQSVHEPVSSHRGSNSDYCYWHEKHNVLVMAPPLFHCLVRVYDSAEQLKSGGSKNYSKSTNNTASNNEEKVMTGSATGSALYLAEAHGNNYYSYHFNCNCYTTVAALLLTRSIIFQTSLIFRIFS